MHACLNRLECSTLLRAVPRSLGVMASSPGWAVASMCNDDMLQNRGSPIGSPVLASAGYSVDS